MYQIERDCKHYKNDDEKDGCRILKKLYCRKEKCTWYKKKGEKKNENNVG